MTDDWLPSSSPGFIGAAMGMLIGMTLFGYGVWSFFAPDPPPMPQSFALVVAGFVEWTTCFFTMRMVRAAWAFAVSINGTGVLLFLFGTPQVRDAFGVGIGLAFLPAVAFLLVTILLVVSAEDFG